MPSTRLRALAGSLLLGLALPTSAVSLSQMNLVTDDPSVNAAQITDPGLKNAWGISFSATSPFWVSSADAGTAVLYSVDPLTQATAKVGLTVAVPGVPTGQVFNPTADFNDNRFLFVSAVDGIVSGWRPALGTTAEVLVPGSTANSYTGAALGSLSGNSFLYAANFKAGSIDVYDGSGAAATLGGSFSDPALPAGYAPFNVQRLGDTLYAAYAVQNDEGDEEVPGPGLGLVDAFSLNGDFLGRVATGGPLNAPWGLAIAPSSFGAWAGALLVGNFGDGRINAYDAVTHGFLGQVTDVNGMPIEIEGLWAITPGNGGSAGSPDLLYFSAGPEDEEHGLFGVLAAVPEPSTYALTLLGLACVAGISRKSARASSP